MIEKRQDVNFRDIEDHDRKYMVRKEHERQAKKERAESVSHNVPYYKKNMWLEQIQEQEQKKKEEQELKEAKRRGQLDKRLKYGHLVNNIFIPKQHKREREQDDVREKPYTPDAALPRIPES